MDKKTGRINKLRDAVCETSVLLLTIFSALVIVFVFIFILNKSWRIFEINKINFITKTGFDRQVIDAYISSRNRPVWVFGAFGLIMGTLTTTLGALVLAVPMGIGTAIVITELAPVWLKRFLQSMIQLLASIPSIIFGLIGLMVVVPFIQNFITTDMQIRYIKYFQLDGKCMLAGIFVLSIMITPIIIALSVDAIKAVPRKYKEASLALGLSHWRTIAKVIVPAAKSGIIAGIILATGRAIGEAIALSMVSGSVGNVPYLSDGIVFFFTPVLTLASAIVNKSEIISVPSVEAALFACGAMLLITSVFLSLATKMVEYLVKRSEGVE